MYRHRCRLPGSLGCKRTQEKSSLGALYPQQYSFITKIIRIHTYKVLVKQKKLWCHDASSKLTTWKVHLQHNTVWSRNPYIFWPLTPYHKVLWSWTPLGLAPRPCTPRNDLTKVCALCLRAYCVVWQPKWSWLQVSKTLL